MPQEQTKELSKKADMVLADLTNNGGLLSPEQNNTFLRVLQDQPTILNEARVVPMNAPTAEINKIQFGSRILRPGVEATGLDSDDRSEVTTSKVTLTTSEVIAEVRIPYAVLEDNVERGTMQNTIIQLIGERAALDIEEIILQGDTGAGYTGDEAVLGLMDGVLKKITSNTVDAGTPAIVGPDVFNNAIKALDGKYSRDRNSLRFYSSYNLEQDYRLAVSARESGHGDAVLTGSAPIRVFGVPLKGIALMPEANMILLNPRNIIVGFQRNVRIEEERLISERMIKIVLTARIAIELEEEAATVKVTNLA